MGLLINSTNTSPQPDSSDAFLDALQSMSSDSDFYYAGKSILKNPDVYSGISKIANTVASCPFVSSTPLITKMLNDPDTTGVRSGFDFWSSVLTNLLIHGNSFCLVENHALRFVQNNQMTVSYDTSTGIIRYTYQPDPSTNAQNVPISQVLHFKINSLDGIAGISPLYALKNEIQLQATGDETLQSVFSSSLRGILKISKTDLSDQSKNHLRDSFQAIAKNGLAISDDTISYEPIELDSSLLKAIQTNNLASSKVASCFNIPQEMIGLENSHSSVSQSLKTMLLQGLIIYFEAIDSELNNKLQGYSISQDKSNILPSSFADKAKTYISLVQNGILQPAEVRSLLNVDTDKDKDNEALNKFYGSLNYSVIDNLSENNHQSAQNAKDSSDNQPTKESGESNDKDSK